MAAGVDGANKRAWGRHGGEDDMHELAEDGWSPADILAAETKILMRTDFRVTFASSVGERTCRKSWESGWGWRSQRESNEEGLGNDEGGFGGTVTALGDGCEGTDANVGRGNCHVGGKLTGLEHSDDSLHGQSHTQVDHTRGEHQRRESSASTAREECRVEKEKNGKNKDKGRQKVTGPGPK